MARGDDTHFGIFLEVRKPFFVRAVRHDVLFHIVVGQSLVGIFEAVGADVALNNLIIGQEVLNSTFLFQMLYFGMKEKLYCIL